MQDFTYTAALALRDSLRKKGKLVISREDASAIGMLVKAWESCQERIRIHRNKPMPGVLRPEKPKPRKRLMSPAPVRVVCTAPEPPSEPEAAVNADAPAEPTAQAAVRNGEAEVSQNHLAQNGTPSEPRASA